MKRFTETTKWDDPWYRKLSSKHKAFWQYLCDKCDNAGVWKKDYELASFQMNETVTEEDLSYINNGKERIVIKSEVLIIKEFVPFQIGNIDADRLTNLQKNCLDLISKYSQKGIDIINCLPVTYPKRSGIGKGKGKGKGNKRGIYKGERPTIEEVTAYCKERNKGVDPEKWYNHYQANGWLVGRNKMKDWRAAVRTWERNAPKYQGKKRPALLHVIEMRVQKIKDVDIKSQLLDDGYSEKEVDTALQSKI